MDSIIEIYARMLISGDWDKDRIPPELADAIWLKKEELEASEEFEGGENI